MATLNVYVKYRPLRIGWCIRTGDMDHLRKALRLTHTMWGGRYNPIIPVDNSELANLLVETFHLDALYPLSDDKNIQDFISKFPYLPWPSIHKKLFIEGMNGKLSTILDIYHPVRHIYEKFNKAAEKPKVRAILYECDPADPIGDVVLCTFGGYPSKDEVGLDYVGFLEKNLSAEMIMIPVNQAIPQDAQEKFTPSEIAGFNLRWHGMFSLKNPGFYIGNVSDFDDLVNYWNLRATTLDLCFYDPAQAERFDALKNGHTIKIKDRLDKPELFEDRVSIWSKKEIKDISTFGEKTMRCVLSDATWNGLNLKPPPVFFDEHSVLASIEGKADNPQVVFQLPEKPFFDDAHFHTQRVVASVRALTDIHDPEYDDRTFQPPFLPELNEYYGRECHFLWNEARSELDGLGIITDVTHDNLTLRLLEKTQLISRIFETFGMKAEPSQPGLICKRLIKQMGGLQGCRVFKITGVRKLIETFSPSKGFYRKEALRIIGESNFSEFKDLDIEPRDTKELTPQNTFLYLLKKGIFRTGISIECPSCLLEFWVPLDNIETLIECEFCGNKFSVVTQLKDQDCWTFRRSGLFGRDDNQEGGIPVALTLQQLDTTLASRQIVYSTAMKISPLSAQVNPCETDFVVLTRNNDGKPQLVIGECKANNDITREDVDNLKKVADAFPRNRMDVFMVFSKTGTFIKGEIDLCKSAKDKYNPRVILLTGRELEPYDIYDRTEKESQINRYSISLEDLAMNTISIFFNRRAKEDDKLSAIT